LQVAGCRLQVAGCRLQVAGCRLQVAGCRLQVKGVLNSCVMQFFNILFPVFLFLNLASCIFKVWLFTIPANSLYENSLLQKNNALFS
jgi:hypothetical protein